MTLYEWMQQHPSAPQWAYDRNDLDPKQTNTYSHKKAWWRCEQGHEWQAQISSVAVQGTACPYCSGKKAIPGQNDLATTHPHLLPLWSDKNTIQPSQVTAGSQKKVWWRCDEGHLWQAQIVSIAVLGTLCPYCVGKRAILGETDLATVRPDVLKEWDYEKNTDISPSEVLPSAHNKVWWKCEREHSWQAVVFSRTKEKGAGCPYCTGRKVLPGFNDLATLKPKVAGEWHPTLNTLRPEDVSLGSNKKVWWECAEGHVWQAAVTTNADSISAEFENFYTTSDADLKALIAKHSTYKTNGVTWSNGAWAATN